MYKMSFVMLHDDRIIHRWVCTERFDSKDAAMKFAQNTVKTFNGSSILVYYRIICA